jgi:hypothetical protein
VFLRERVKCQIREKMESAVKGIVLQIS